jgi:hypothetical protein
LLFVRWRGKNRLFQEFDRMCDILKSRRVVFWICFSVATVGFLIVLLLPSGPNPQPVPPNVKLQGVSRAEAEFLYGNHQWFVRDRLWNALEHCEFKKAQQPLAILRYSRVESITQTASNSSTLVILCDFPGKPPSRYAEPTQYTPFAK